MMVKKSEKICDFCGEIIDPKTRHVLLGTYEGDKTIQEGNYHMQCFSKWFNSKVQEKSINAVQQVGGKVFGMLKGMMPQ